MTDTLTEGVMWVEVGMCARKGPDERMSSVKEWYTADFSSIHQHVFLHPNTTHTAMASGQKLHPLQ